MIKSFFVLAIRNFWKNRIFSLINIAGLSIGISASLVIYLIVHYELNFDRFEKDRASIYRVVTDMHFPDADFKNSGVPGPLPLAVRTGISSVEASAFFWQQSMKVTIDPDRSTKRIFRHQPEIIFADSGYFKLLNYEWLSGSPSAALRQPNEVVLTASRAEQYFPGMSAASVLGKTITYDDSMFARVSGVVRDLKEITDFTFKEFISPETFRTGSAPWGDDWGSVSSSSQFFVKLRPGTDTALFNRQLAAIRKQHEKEAYLATDHFLQPLSDIHFNAEFDAFDHRLGHKPTLYGLMAVAVFLLLLGCINFINLTTSLATQRAKEIGIRKTMGSSRSQLVFQFLAETLLMTVIAAVVSVILTPWLLHIFSAYIPEGLHLDLLHQPAVIGFIVSLVLVVSLLAGCYPALILSGYKPILVLKNIAYGGTAMTRRAWVRKTLTVSQFVIAQFFIIATLVVGKQVRYSLNMDLGFKKNAIVYFTLPVNYDKPDGKAAVLAQRLRSLPGIERLSLAGAPPAYTGTNISTMKSFSRQGKEVETSVEVKYADTAYCGLYGIRLKAGRNLRPSDTSGEYLVNETYMKMLGYQDPSAIIGHLINQQLPIVGVIADIHTKSVHSSISPLAITTRGKLSSFIHLALPSHNGAASGWKQTLATVAKQFHDVYPDEDFEYQFFDQSLAKFYKKEQDTVQLLNWCTGLTIFISCLGLLGLVMYTTTQRNKEIGVRKVLGASVSQIVALLTKDFMLLVILAFIIASPLAWWAMSDWLRDFAYRTEFSWWLFLLAGAMMFVVALVTLSIQTV
ncbi:MAG TPA: FtsX-like permease family protein, partial [Chitinophagaceae bacterium]